MAGKRKTHTAAFKAQVALAAVKGDRTVNELAAHFGVHPTLIHGWKKQLLGGAEAVFAGAKANAPADDRTAELFERIGRLKVELDWVKKKLPRSADQLRPLIDPSHPTLSVRRQCQLIGLTRSSYDLPPTEESAENLALMTLIDRQDTACPFYGSRRIAAWLRRNGHAVNRKRVRRLLRIMGLEALYPKPKLSLTDRRHRVVTLQPSERALSGSGGSFPVVA